MKTILQQSAVAGCMLALVAWSGCGTSRDAAVPPGADGANAIAPLARRVAEQLLMEGSALQMQQRYADAAERYGRALRLAPRLGALRYAMARCYQALGNNDSALSRASEAVAMDPGNVDAMMLRASLLTALGRTSQAISEYESILRLHPTHVQARYNAAVLLERSDPARAIEHYEYIRRNITSDYSTLLNLAQIYTTERRYLDAIGAERELLVLSPNDMDIYTLLASSCLLAGRYDEAIAMLDDVERFAPSDSAYAVFLAARAAPIAEGRVPAVDTNVARYAAALGEHLRAIPSGRWRSWLSAALLHFRLGELDSADAELARALALASAGADDWVDAATAYIQGGHATRALGFLEPTASRFGDDARVHSLLGYVLFTAGRLADAERELRRSVALDDMNGTAWGYLGAVCQRQGKWAASENAYRRALDIDPDDASLLNNAAYALASMGRRLDYALSLIDRALAEQPENESFLDTKGWIHFHRKEYNEALRYIQRSVDIGGASAEVLEHLGDTQAAMGDTAAARASYTRALRLDATNPALRRKLDALGAASSGPR